MESIILNNIGLNLAVQIASDFGMQTNLESAFILDILLEGSLYRKGYIYIKYVINLTFSRAK